ncbi:MAG: hypothetical protein FJZ93_09920 [Chloroflexi bacterium]|nr:hypothetical protein [Chloroflexota bacterium]
MSRIAKLAPIFLLVFLCASLSLCFPLANTASATSPVVIPTTTTTPQITSDGKLYAGHSVRISVNLNSCSTIQGTIYIGKGDNIGGAPFYIEDAAGNKAHDFGRVVQRNFQSKVLFPGQYTIVIRNLNQVINAWYTLTYDIVPSDCPKPAPTSTPVPTPTPTPSPATSCGSYNEVKLPAGHSARININLNSCGMIQGTIYIGMGDNIGGAPFYIKDAAGNKAHDFGRVVQRNFQSKALYPGQYTIVIRNLNQVINAWYTLTCNILPSPCSPGGNGGGVTPKPIISYFTANPTSINRGDSATLSWSVTGVTSISIDQGIGSKPSLGSVVVQPYATTTYILTANNAGGTASKSVTIAVSSDGGGDGSTRDGQPVIALFSANPGNIAQGQISTLTWHVSNAAAATIDQGIGNVALSGTRIVSPNMTTLYTLTANNSTASITATALVMVIETPEPDGNVIQGIISFIRKLLGLNK